MKQKIVTALAIVLFVTATTGAHDLFMKLDSYFLAPNTRASVRLLNGTFQKSDGLVARDRFRDISLYNEYLQHDGIPDTLAVRKKNNELNKDVRERYSKHVRAVFQVGDTLSDDYKRQLNYPAEIIPQQNPYALKAGDRIHVLCTVDGQPVSNQFVMAGWESADGKLHLLDTRTNESGLASLKLAGAGKWFVKFIHMTPLSQPDLNYESKWAGLTFEIRNTKRAQ